MDKKLKMALAGVAQELSAGLRTKGSPVQFPVDTHAWGVSQVPSRGHERDNHTLKFPSPSIPPSLKIS